MNFSSSLKKIICLLLAALMLFATIGCQGTTKKKKKVIKKKQQVIVRPSDDDDDENDDNNLDFDTPDDDHEDTDTEDKKSLPERPLPEVAVVEGGYVHWEEPVIPEFEYEYANLNITEDYVIVYALENWENRKESATKVGENADGTPILKDRYISQTGIARLSAYDLQTYFKDKLNLKLPVMKDTEVDPDAKKILIGNTAYSPKSTLGENDFAVKVSGDDLVFEAGHVALITKSVKWYETVKIEPGKVAILKGTTEDFKSYVTLNGVRYDWVWGDEFDGSELNNDDNWKQSKFGEGRGDDFVNVHNDPQFQYIENGKIRLSADRYYNEGDPTKGYASSGEISSDGVMQYRNGYVEMRARLPYRRGAFPALWTMSNSDNRDLPNYYFNDGYGQYNKLFWTIEFDLFESFADADHMTTTLHKWYSDGGIGSIRVPDTPEQLTDDQVKELAQRAYDNHYHSWVNETHKTNFMFDDEYISNHFVKFTDRYAFDSQMLTKEVKDENDNVIGKKYVYYPIYLQFDDGTEIDIFNYRLRPFTNMSASGNTYAYSFTYPGTNSDNILGNVKDGKYKWTYQFNPETINQEYHTYAFHITSDHCTVSLDGDAFLDFDWDPAYDYRDVNGDGVVEDIGKNNNGVGFNLWHYLMVDMMIYTPGNFSIDEARKLQPGDTPFHLYVDWIRCYQDLDDPSQALWFPNGEAD